MILRLKNVKLITFSILYVKCSCGKIECNVIIHGNLWHSLWEWVEKTDTTLTNLLNLTSGREAFHLCLINFWPKDECTTISAHSQSEQFFCWDLRQISLPQFSFISPRFKLFDFIFILTLSIFFVSKRKKKKKRKEKRRGNFYNYWKYRD